jgi:hypothetical protein
MINVLILSFSHVNTDPRVLRQINYFEKTGAKISLSAVSYEGKLPFYPLTKPKSLFFRMIKFILMVLRINRLREKEFLIHSSLSELRNSGIKFDLIFANDAETWPVALALKKSMPESKLIFDAHEHYAKQFNDLWTWNWFHKRFANYLCEEFIPKADEFFTVCEGIAADYEKDYGRRPKLILNSPDFDPTLTPVPVGDKIRLVHHGIAIRSRKIEKMIRMMDFLDERFTLDLILVSSDEGYIEELQALSGGKNVFFPKPVATFAISAFLNQYDMGVFLLEPTNFNYEYALPNKFFEFIQGRLAIAIGPSPEMKRIVEKEQIGIVSTKFDEKELASLINNLNQASLNQMKSNSDQVAEYYSNQQNEKLLSDTLKKLSLN